MKDFQGYRQKKNNEFAQQKAQRLELRNGKKISHSRNSDKHRVSYCSTIRLSSRQVKASILASLHDINMSVANGVCLEEQKREVVFGAEAV